MTSTLKVVGGILALIGGALMIIPAFVTFGPYLTSGVWYLMLNWIINVLIAILALVGGITAITGKIIVGKVVLVTGIIIILLHLLASTGISVPLYYITLMYSIFNTFDILIRWIAVEGIIILIGGILCLAGEKTELKLN